MERVTRVWLEGGYDHGRWGAWMLDLPGCFAWGPDRDGALARVPSAVSRFTSWLAAHGESMAGQPQPQPGRPELVEEVAAVRLDDGYEVNATFAADDRAVAADELARTIRWLGHARADLATLVDRLRAFESGGGRLPVEAREAAALESGADPGRTADEVLRHVAGAEAWFGSRLDPAARYEGPPRDGDLDEYLAATRGWLVHTLRRLHEADPRATRTDGGGERWTLAKVLRRALYHSLDHWAELDRRLALAERRADRLELRRNAPVDPDRLRALSGAVGLWRRAHDSRERTERMLAGSTETVSLWDGPELVGFGRIISDEATNGYISTMVVAPEWQDRGLGSRILAALIEGREDIKLTLDARLGAIRFYERHGFGRVDTVLVRPRGGPAERRMVE